MTPWEDWMYSLGMPGRKVPLVTGQVYHIFNRSIWSVPIFNGVKDHSRAIKTMWLYQNKDLPSRYSIFLTLSLQHRQEILEMLKKRKKFLVEIIAYCFMPNHIHLILKQVFENGISKFMSNISNSYTRYFNTKYGKNGALFEGRFKAIRVETDEQLLHLSRYVHLNPFSSHVIKSIEALERYPYSSFSEYVGKDKADRCTKRIILSHFKAPKDYKKFVFDQADYQKELEYIKHLILDE